MENDTISRETLLNEFNDKCQRICPTCEYHKWNTKLERYECELINIAPTVERPQGEWILCSDRLPKQNGYYTTTCQDICENRVHIVGFDGVRKKWGRGGVLAWQPLPEPYK